MGEVGGENQTDQMLGMLGFNAKQHGKFFTKVEKRPKIHIFGPAWSSRSNYFENDVLNLEN